MREAGDVARSRRGRLFRLAAPAGVAAAVLGIALGAARLSEERPQAPTLGTYAEPRDPGLPYPAPARELKAQHEPIRPDEGDVLVVAATRADAGTARLAAYLSHGRPCLGFLDDPAAPATVACTSRFGAESDTGIDAYAASSTAYAESPEAANRAPRPQEFVWGVAPAGTRSVELSRAGTPSVVAHAYAGAGRFGNMSFWITPFRAVGLTTHLRAFDEEGGVLAERDYGPPS